MRHLLNQKGQTAVEYTLMIVVAIGIGVAFKKKMEDFLISSPNSIVTQSLNGFKTRFNADSNGRYKWFPLRR